MGYRELYWELFSAVTDALKQLRAGNSLDALQILMRAQRVAEDTFLEENFEE